MHKAPSKKTIFYIIIIAIVVVLAYLYFSGAPADNSASLEEAGAPTSESSIVAANVLALLNQISALKIETAIFTNPVYKSLVDHTVPVLEQNIGRENPFTSSSIFVQTPPPPPAEAKLPAKPK